MYPPRFCPQAWNSRKTVETETPGGKVFWQPQTFKMSNYLPTSIIIHAQKQIYELSFYNREWMDFKGMMGFFLEKSLSVDNTHWPCLFCRAVAICRRPDWAGQRRWTLSDHLAGGGQAFPQACHNLHIHVTLRPCFGSGNFLTHANLGPYSDNWQSRSFKLYSMLQNLALPSKKFLYLIATRIRTCRIFLF